MPVHKVKHVHKVNAALFNRFAIRLNGLAYIFTFHRYFYNSVTISVVNIGNRDLHFRSLKGKIVILPTWSSLCAFTF